MGKKEAFYMLEPSSSKTD